MSWVKDDVSITECLSTLKQNPGAATEVLSRVIEELARKEAWPHSSRSSHDRCQPDAPSIVGLRMVRGGAKLDGVRWAWLVASGLAF